MGQELTLQAISASSMLFDRVVDGSISPMLLGSVDSYYDARRKEDSLCREYINEAPESDIFTEALEQMLQDNPGIDQRCCYLNRHYSWLHMTLGWAVTSESDKLLADWAVLGEKQIIPGALSTQGFSIKWNCPETCQLVNIWLSDLDASRIKTACDVDKLRYYNAYKIQQSPDDKYVRECIMCLFQNIKSFYITIAEENYGVIFDLD